MSIKICLQNNNKIVSLKRSLTCWNTEKGILNQNQHFFFKKTYQLW
nr:MAG TPA_asm: hypothetical protein [Caudoviricetes sp.]